jgi:hypothetical protein
MKKITCLLSLVFFFSAFSPAQNLADTDTGKYRINLPDFWKPGNKIWEILTDKLPLVCEELVNKDLCGDQCNPKYSIEFEMSEPEILDNYFNQISSGHTTDTWQFVTLYSFSSYLLLFNEKDELLTRLTLVDKDEVWRVVRQEALAASRPATPSRYYPVNRWVNGQNQISQQLQQLFSRPGGGQSPHTYFERNKDKLFPNRRDMLGVIDEKIRAW